MKVQEVPKGRLSEYAGPRKPLTVKHQGPEPVDLSELAHVIGRVVEIEILGATEVHSTEVLQAASNLDTLGLIGCKKVSSADLALLPRLRHVRLEDCLSSALASPGLREASLWFSSRPEDLLIHAPLDALRWEGVGADDLSWVRHPENLTEVVIVDPGVVDVSRLKRSSNLQRLVLSGCSGVTGLQELHAIPRLYLDLWNVKSLDDPGVLVDMSLGRLEVNPNYVVSPQLAAELKQRVSVIDIRALKPRRWAASTTKARLSLVGDVDVVSFNPIEVRRVGERFVLRLVPGDTIENDVATEKVDAFVATLDSAVSAFAPDDGEVVIDHEAGELIYETSTQESAEQLARLILERLWSAFRVQKKP